MTNKRGRKRKGSRGANSSDVGSHFVTNGQAQRRRTSKKMELTSSSSTEGAAATPGSSGRMTVINDEWQTALESWKQIAPLFKGYENKHIWMPFYYDGECAKHLKSLGFKKVHHKKQDFFNKLSDVKFVEKIDLIWDNPPYTGASLKERVLRALVKTSKPFSMLLPSSILHSKLLQDITDLDQVQCIIPRRVFVRKTQQNSVPFKYLVWLCYKMNLPKDLIFV